MGLNKTIILIEERTITNRVVLEEAKEKMEASMSCIAVWNVGNDDPEAHKAMVTSLEIYQLIGNAIVYSN